MCAAQSRPLWVIGASDLAQRKGCHVDAYDVACRRNPYKMMCWHARFTRNCKLDWVQVIAVKRVIIEVLCPGPRWARARCPTFHILGSALAIVSRGVLNRVPSRRPRQRFLCRCNYLLRLLQIIPSQWPSDMVSSDSHESRGHTSLPAHKSSTSIKDGQP
jgi:hypothetical protein